MGVERLGVTLKSCIRIAIGGLCLAAVFAPSVWAATLPDGRIYEQVSPPHKNAADVIPNETRLRVAADGNRVIFASLTGFGDVRGIGVTSEYLALRDPQSGSWSTHGITPPEDATGYFGTVNGIESYYIALSKDLAQGVLSTGSPLTDAPNVASAINLYKRDDLLSAGAGSYALMTDSPTPQAPSLAPVADPGTGTYAFRAPRVAAVSADFSHILFESQRNLTPDAPSCVAFDADNNCPSLLYEAVDGTVRLVGILPASEGGGVAPASQAGRGVLGGTVWNLADGTLSEDGSRAIFTVPASLTEPDGKLYLRDDHGTSDIADDTTVRIDESERTTPDPAGAKPAEFWAASADGSLVFFTTSEQLTNDDTNASKDVYRFDLNAPPGSRLTRISVDNEPADGLESNCEGVIGVSADGQYVYFATLQNQLVAGGPTGPAGGPGDTVRIFAWHDGTEHEVAAVNNYDLVGILGSFRPRAKTSRLTPDGTHLTFITEHTDELLSLYGHPAYDHGSGCPSNTTPECDEVYVYDATANGGDGDLRCASCNPTGAPATSDALISGVPGLGGFAADTAYQNHAMTDDGRFVFFNTAERLQPEDQNSVLDAYEYDTTTHQVHLISGGRGSDISLFLDASPDGHDVLFVTRDRLRSTDTDQSRDLYDARVNGNPDPGAPRSAICDGENCRPPATSAAPPSAPPSMGTGGPGDVSDASDAPAVFSMQSLTAQQRRVLAKRGKAHITVQVSQPGAIRLDVMARIAGRWRNIETIKRTLKHGAVIKLPIRLNGAARHHLERRGRLQLKVATTYSQSARLQTLRVMLRT